MPKQPPLISVIVPVYNVEKYLSQCINSIINQTYTNLEIILIDDGSTDSSGKVCDQCAKTDCRIKVFHKENEGLGLTRNYGLEKISGEYVTFVDSDDYVADDIIETMYRAASQHKVDLCKAGFTRVSNNGKAYSVRQYEKQVYSGFQVKTEFLPRMFGSTPQNKDSLEICVCASLYRSSIIKDHHLHFVSERTYLSEDIFFNIDYVQYATKVCLIDYHEYYYRFNPKSLSRKYKPDFFEKNKFLFNTLRKKIQNLGYSTPEIHRLSRLFFVNLRGCLSQEKNSDLSKQQIKNNIRSMCNDPLTQELINNYPIRQLGFKQSIFLRLVRQQAVNVLYLLVKLGVI